jgi:transposase
MPTVRTRSTTAQTSAAEASPRQKKALERCLVDPGTGFASVLGGGTMGYGYGLDLRTRIVDAYKNGEGSIRDIAERFAVSPGTVQDYLKLKRSTGRLDPRPVSGGVEPLIDTDGLRKVGQLVGAQPDATTEELADRFAREHCVAVSRPTMGRALQRLGITRKKNAPRDRAGQSARAEGAAVVPTGRENAARATSCLCG